jgi:hypothetical protein
VRQRPGSVAELERMRHRCTGNVPQAITVTDTPTLDGFGCTPANGSTVAPSDSITCTGSHTVTQADLTAGKFDDTACADGAGATEACAGKDVPGVQRCTVASSISSNFNGTPIAAGNYIWFSAVLKASGLGSKPVTITMTGSTITFAANRTNYTLSTPNAQITFDPSATTATTTYDAGSNTGLRSCRRRVWPATISWTASPSRSPSTCPAVSIRSPGAPSSPPTHPE